MTGKERRKRKRRKLSPYYGKGDGSPSAATQPAYRALGRGGSSQGPAYPGSGGINSPGVPAGPNAGMGPISASYDPLGMQEFEALLAELSVQSSALRKRS